MDNIGKVVIYKFKQDGVIMERVRIFYKDGTDEDVSTEELPKVIQAIAKQENITKMSELQRFFNTENGRIFTMSKDDMMNNYDSFRYQRTNNLSSDNNRINLNSNDYQNEFDRNESIVNRVKNKLKNSKLAQAITIGTIGAVAISALSFGFSKNNKDGQMHNSNLATSQTTSNQANDKLSDHAVDSVVFDNNFDSLLQNTNSSVQKDAMRCVGDYLRYFNGPFADKFVENGKNIRAALTWDEVMSMYIAYNDFSKEDIRAIFNGCDISSSEFYSAYKNATLQLMGAYVLETRDVQVEAYRYIISTEGKQFVKDYNELFLQAKEATGLRKVELVKQFYSKIRKDFALTDEVCATGISHADNTVIEKYKLAVIPMIVAGEILFQNLSVDYTLSDQEIKYFNEQGLCNVVQDIFERTEFILLASSAETTGVKYSEFREALIKELTEKNIYVIDDAHRNLNELSAFIRVVNVQNECFGEGIVTTTINNKSSNFSSSSSRVNHSSTKTTTSSNTTYRTETKTTTTSNRTEAINKAGRTAVEKAEQEVNVKIQQENETNKKNAETQSEINRQKLQEEANRQSEENRRIVEQSEKDLQEKINNANNNIKTNKTVNEKDFGDHNVKFDQEHSDNKGNLDNSVKDITTDNSNVKKGTSLPDPNKTGAEFDKKANGSSSNTTNNNTNKSNLSNNNSSSNSSKNESSSSNSSSSTNSSSSSNSGERFYTEEVTNTTKNASVDMPKTGISTPASKSVSASSSATDTSNNNAVKKSAGQTIIEYDEPVTNTQIVDAYLKSLEGVSSDESAKTYSK